MTKLSRRGFLGSLAGSSAGFLTAVTLPKAAFAADQAPQKWDQTVDLLVVGAGGAGLASAVSAAQHGVKNIVVLEKMPFFGGNTSISGGGFNSVDPVRQGMKFKDDVYQIYGGLYPRCHAPYGSLGSDYIKVLKPQCDKEGINILTNSRVVRIFRENQLSGKVLGVEYVDKDGQHKTVKAQKAVIVA